MKTHGKMLIARSLTLSVVMLAACAWTEAATARYAGVVVAVSATVARS
jgi:hypothetical protein